MSGDGLFHIDPHDQLVSMTVTPYSAEDVLQQLLESHADLLAGGQMTPHAPRRWLLIRRLQGVPDAITSAGRWSVDHLFVDQDAIPTLVEVKRSTDTRIRREVVGQMLDYAANGVRYWPIEDLRAAFEVTQRNAGIDPQEAVEALCEDSEISVEGFFGRVSDNLRAGRIRMVFVADVVPDELQRITEFLNEQMDPAEVFAVEVKQYKADGYPGTVVVPTVFGRTAAAISKSRTRPRADRADAVARADESTRRVLDLTLEVARERDLLTRETPSGILLKTAAGESIANVYLADYNAVDFALKPLRDRGLESTADELLAQLSGMTAKRLTDRYPSVPADDVLTHWPEVVQVFDLIARSYRLAPS